MTELYDIFWDLIGSLTLYQTTLCAQLVHRAIASLYMETRYKCQAGNVHPSTRPLERYYLGTMYLTMNAYGVQVTVQEIPETSCNRRLVPHRLTSIHCRIWGPVLH